jgi:hypothetical protein
MVNLGLGLPRAPQLTLSSAWIFTEDAREISRTDRGLCCI